MLTLRYVRPPCSGACRQVCWPWHGLGGGADPGQSPAQAAPATGDKQPAPAASPEEIAKLVEQLDADLFADCQTASEKLGYWPPGVGGVGQGGGGRKRRTHRPRDPLAAKAARIAG